MVTSTYSRLMALTVGVVCAIAVPHVHTVFHLPTLLPTLNTVVPGDICTRCAIQKRTLASTYADTTDLTAGVLYRPANWPARTKSLAVDLAEPTALMLAGAPLLQSNCESPTSPILCGPTTGIGRREVERRHQDPQSLSLPGCKQ